MQDSGPPPHRLHRRADPLKRQRLPRWQLLNPAVPQENRKVGCKMLRLRPGRNGDQQRPTPRCHAESSQSHRAGRRRHRCRRAQSAEESRQRRVLRQVAAADAAGRCLHSSHRPPSGLSDWPNTPDSQLAVFPPCRAQCLIPDTRSAVCDHGRPRRAGVADKCRQQESSRRRRSGDRAK